VNGIASSEIRTAVRTAVIADQPLHVRWLGSVTYTDALALQLSLQRGSNQHLLLLEHTPTYTMGVRAKAEHLLVDVEAAGAALVHVNRGGDVTYHGPGQLVGYPIVTALGRRGGGLVDTAAYVAEVEQLVIDLLDELGLSGALRRDGHAGVWLNDSSSKPESDAAPVSWRKIAAIGVRIDRGRTLHGFSLNVDRRVDEGFARIVPCGIHDSSVTSLEAEGITVSMQTVVETLTKLVVGRWGSGAGSTVDALAWRVRPSDLAMFSREGAVGVTGATRGRESFTPGGSVAAPTPTPSPQPVRMRGRLAEAGVTGQSVSIRDRKPDWMRVKAEISSEYLQLRQTVRSLDLVTVCEEAGCPNIFECWSSGTATFMVLGERCTRACGFCLVDTSKPLAADPDEPARVAKAVQEMRLKHAVITMVARDDLPDGGAQHVAETIGAIRTATPSTKIEVLVSDHQGVDADLHTLFVAKPDVFNHNIETVLRLQRAVRPSASYARSLSVLGRAKAAGLVTKSGIILGMGETLDEVRRTLIDLRSVGVDIVTIGQYLRPTERHLPVNRWVTPAEFEELRVFGMDLGFAHVESSPLTRSSYHAQEGADAARGASS
jgi:lipoyl synthase